MSSEELKKMLNGELEKRYREECEKKLRAWSENKLRLLEALRAAQIADINHRIDLEKENVEDTLISLQKRL